MASGDARPMPQKNVALGGIPLLSLKHPMQSHVLGVSHDDEVRNIVIEFVPVDVMDDFFISQGSADVLFHDMPVLECARVRPREHQNTITTLVDAGVRRIGALSFRLAIPTHEGVVIFAKPFRECARSAFIDRAYRVSVAKRLTHNARVSVPTPAMVMRSAHAAPDTWLAAIINHAERFLARHVPSILHISLPILDRGR